MVPYAMVQRSAIWVQVASSHQTCGGQAADDARHISSVCGNIGRSYRNFVGWWGSVAHAVVAALDIPGWIRHNGRIQKRKGIGASTMVTQGVFFRRVLLVIVGVSLLTTGGVIRWRRWIADPAGCLAVDLGERRTLLDGQSKRWMDEITPFAEVKSLISPDGQYEAHLLYGTQERSLLRILRKPMFERSPASNGEEMARVSLQNVDIEFSQLRWAADSQWVVASWTDAQSGHGRLIALAAVGGGRHEAWTTSGLFVEAPSFSPDGQYVLLREKSGSVDQLHLFSMPTLSRTTLQPDYMRLLSAPQWSPTGHWLTWLQTDGTPETATDVWIAFASPESSVKRVALRLSTPHVGDIIKENMRNNHQRLQIRWSQRQPDGDMRVIVLFSTPIFRLVSVTPNAYLKNEINLKNPYPYKFYSGTSAMETLVTQPDGTRFLFVRPTDSLESYVHGQLQIREVGTLFAYDLIERKETVILRNVVAANSHGNFNIAPTLDADTGRVIVPTWNGESFNIHLVSAEGGLLRTLVKGAAGAIVPFHDHKTRFRHGSPFFSGGRWIVFVWRDNRSQVHLLWAKSDGSDVRDIAPDAEFGSLVRLLQYDEASETLAFEQLHDPADANAATKIHMVHLPTGKITSLRDAVQGGWLPLRMLNESPLRAPFTLEQSSEWLAFWRQPEPTLRSKAFPTYWLEVRSLINGKRIEYLSKAAVDLDAPDQRMIAISFSPNRQYALLVLDAAEIALIEVETSTILWRQPHPDWSLSAARASWSPDGSMVGLVFQHPTYHSHRVEVYSVKEPLIGSTVVPMSHLPNPTLEVHWTDCG